MVLCFLWLLFLSLLMLETEYSSFGVYTMSFVPQFSVSMKYWFHFLHSNFTQFISHGRVMVHYALIIICSNILQNIISLNWKIYDSKHYIYSTLSPWDTIRTEEMTPSISPNLDAYTMINMLNFMIWYHLFWSCNVVYVFPGTFFTNCSRNVFSINRKDTCINTKQMKWTAI